MEDLLAALAERARASSGPMAARDQDANPAEDTLEPSGDAGAAAQQNSNLPSTAQLEEGTSSPHSPAGCLWVPPVSSKVLQHC